MSNSKLLEEAIIDAEALREAALKNAEQTILEKYAPEVKTAIESLLEQELPGGPDSMMADEAAMTSQPNQELDVSLAATDGEKLCPCPDNDESVTISLGYLKDKLEKMIMDVSSEAAVPGEEEPMGMEPDMTQEPMDMAPETTPEEEEELPEEEPALQEQIELDEDLIMSILNEEEEQEDEEEEEDDKKGEDENSELTPAQKELDVAEPKGKLTGADFKKLGQQNENKTVVLKNAKMLVENKKVLNENKLLTEKIEKLLEQHNELLEENKKVKQAALQISQRLEETNLSNAILLYKNQALGSDSLNERQKNKIVEAVSKAGSVDEVKMIYETLCNAVGSFDNKGPQSLSEAVEQKVNMTLKPRQEKNSNSNPLHSRWQKIAGIKK